MVRPERVNALLLSFVFVLIIGLGVWVFSAGKRYREEYAQATEGWRVGNSRMVELTLRTNAILQPFLAARGIVLVDMKLEFGRHHGAFLLGDEICPDTCRVWDGSSGEKLDKDRFRRDLGRVEEAYQEIARRVGA